MMSVAGKTCPYCQFPIKPGVEAVSCSKCGIPHHKQCWAQNNRCTTFGCDGVPQASSDSAVGKVSNGRLDLTISGVECPRCGVENPVASDFCHRCGTSINGSQQNAPPAYPVQQQGIPYAANPPPGGPVYYGNFPPNIDNHMAFAIFSTLCCCIPGGIYAIVLAGKVKPLASVGDYNGALKAAENAKEWCWISVGLGIVVAILMAISKH